MVACATSSDKASTRAWPLRGQAHKPDIRGLCAAQPRCQPRALKDKTRHPCLAVFGVGVFGCSPALVFSECCVFGSPVLVFSECVSLVPPALVFSESCFLVGFPC